MGVFDSLKDIGKFQWSCMLLYGVTGGSFIVVNVIILLIAPRIDFRCTDSTPAFQNLTLEEQKQLMNQHDQCLRPDIDFSNMTKDELLDLNTTTVNTSKCDLFVYDKSVFKLTATEQFNLVCDREWLLSLAKTIYMAGYLVGALTCGSLADRFGRKIVMVVTGFLTTFWNLLCGFAPNIELFLLSRFLLATSCIAFFTAGIILHTELVRMDQRKVPRGVTSYSIGIVGITISGIGLILVDYRYLQTLMAAIAFIGTVATWIHIPESPRWLCAQNRYEEAEAIVDRIAKFNNCDKTKYAYLLHIAKTQDDHTKTTLLDLYRSPLLRKRSLILATLWFCHILVFYALLFNLDQFWPDVRVSMMISAAIEIPTLCIPFFTIDYFGRQFMSSFFMITCAICCFLMSPFVTTRGSPWLLVFAVTGKLLAVNQFFIATVFIQEVYPTNLRTQGLGAASTIARIAGMISPQLTLLDQFWPPLSAVLMGGAALFAGLLVPTLPDTTDTELPVTIEDGENFFKDHTYSLQIAFLTKRKKQRLLDRGDTENGKMNTAERGLESGHLQGGHM